MVIGFACALVFGVATQTASAGLIGPPLTTCQLVASNCVNVKIGTVDGNGSGTITSTPAGINCTVAAGVKSGKCEYDFIFPTSQPTIAISLIRAAAQGSGACWKYCDSDDDFRPSDGITFSNASPGTTWTETLFNFRLTKQQLSVTKTGAGTGKVTSAPAGIDCGSACSRSFDYGSAVTLTATPDAGAVFKSWTGACNGQGATCKLTITAATSTNAVFELPAAGGATPPPPASGSTGGTTGGTTGGAGGTTGGAGGTGGSDTTVAAELIAVKAGRSRLGKRIVQVELNLDEKVSAALKLVRGGTTLASKSLANVKAGNRVLTIVVPNAVAKGKASLEIELKNSAGGSLSVKRTVKLPKP